MTEDEHFMKRALWLSERARGQTSPNPLVGAVLVRDGRVVGEGYHRRAGESHAEVVALDRAGDLAQGATLYVSLEPCCHYGRTPPCVDRIIERGVSEVVCALIDPDPRVSGRGIEKLREAGIEARLGVLEEAARKTNEVYLKYITTGMPFVTLKLAQSLDGRIATSSGDSKWITGERARRFVHRLRSQVDAVMVGVETVIQDDPQLNVRWVKGKHPLKIVLDSRLRIPMAAQVFGGERTILATTERSSEEKRRLIEKGAQVWILPEQDGHVDLTEVMRKAGREGITSILIEGGSKVATSAIKAGVVDKLLIFIAPKLIGAGTDAVGDLGIARIEEAIELEDVKLRKIGEDVLYRAMISKIAKSSKISKIGRG
ncbi:MAG: bifunctional diaminohydroxyphosphoribosylaminopyrimidine deaminase/5-amino-6-(5-phosphoribosylamino)uracil reductase RibD [Candidatus Latescibacteria bacterium]|nr:bifunctional diaminohydroxyphosphoribosylaminopyrimidine deaminase/5-amino-6-(5-phosphoribosylamino)uracil reductase RibD [Candidatus Latescibacterota bacterium]